MITFKQYKDVSRIVKNYKDYDIIRGPNTLGDPVRLIYYENGLGVRVCDRWKYLEIIGSIPITFFDTLKFYL